MRRALESIWPWSTPWRAQVGLAWCRLCQDSPIDRIASHQTLADLSWLVKGRSPMAWQIELIDHVTWWSRPMRTSDPQKKAVAAPCQDIDHRPPMTAGVRTETAINAGNAPWTRRMSLSAIRSGAYLAREVCSTSKSQPMCAHHRPLISAGTVSPYRQGEWGSPWRYGETVPALIRGLWWAHIGWLFDVEQTSRAKYAPDLMADKDMRRVHGAFPALIAVSVLTPAVIGGLWSMSWQGAATAFFWGSLVRIGLLHHVTWSINSCL